MPGLFDFLNDPQSAGLLGGAGAILNASGPSLVPRSFGQILGAGLDGMQQARAQQQAMAMRELQTKALQGEMQDKEKARQDALAAQEWYRKYSQGDATAPARSVLGSNLSPTTANAELLAAAPPAQQQATDMFSQRLAQAQAMRASGIPALMAQADKLEEQALKFKPKFETKPQVVRGPDGNPMLVQTADDGTVRALPGGYGVAEKLEFRDGGGSIFGLDSYSGKQLTQFRKTQSPDSIAADQRAAADRAAAGEDAVMDPLAVRLTAQQYLAGDTSALQNFGRGAQGAKNLNAVRLEITKQANAQGLTGADIAAKNAEFGGIKAGQRTAATRSAGIEIAANEAAQLAPLALEASAKVARSGFLPFGKAQVMFDANVNDPSMRQFAMANTALVNAYGQAMARGGTATVSDKEHAREMLATAMDQPSYTAAVQQMMREIEAARSAPTHVRSALSDSVSGRNGKTASNPVAGGGQFSVTAPNGKTYTFSDAKSLANFKLSAGIQ